MEESKEVSTPPPTIRRLSPHGQSAAITMSIESRMTELEALQKDNKERFALTDFRFDSIDAGIGRMESMM
jgi:hypothetical protein